MKRILAVISLVIIALLAFLGCKSEGYTPDDAVDNGQLAIIYEEDDARVYGGEGEWKEFLNNIENNKDCTLQIVSFIGDDYIMEQISFRNGRYYYYNSNKDDDMMLSTVNEKEYKYLRKLTGITPGSNMESVFYVLTDSLELTWEDVFQSLISSNLETVSDIEYEILWCGTLMQ